MYYIRNHVIFFSENIIIIILFKVRVHWNTAALYIKRGNRWETDFYNSGEHNIITTVAIYVPVRFYNVNTLQHRPRPVI